MPNTREKLIELLELSDACLCDLCGEKGAIDRVAGVIADNLIANDVTVNEWISVKDRLPTEEDANEWGLVFAYTEDKKCLTVDWQAVCCFCDVFVYWMPLPQPPKEE